MRRAAQPPSGRPSGDPWTVTGYLIAGPAFYGGLGWLVARWWPQPWLVPLGVIIGMVLALLLVYLRYGRL